MKSFFAIFIVIAVSTGSAFAAPRQKLAGHVPAAVPNLAPNGRLPGKTQLKLAIGLPLRNKAALDSLMRALYDPASPQYRQYLTPEQFTDQFGPTTDDYEAVVNFARTNGFTVTATHSDRMLLEVTGAVTDIERAFQVSMRLYPHPKEARSFYAPDSEPSVPSDLSIADISGMNNYSYAHTKNLRPRPIRPGRLEKNTSMDGSGPNGNLIGTDYRAAYAPGVTNTGTGQIVGVLEFDGYYPTDISAYATQANLTNPPPVTNILIAGFDGTPGSGNSEVALDIEMAMSMAPGLSEIMSFEASSNTVANVILSAMATNITVNQFSCSWDFSSNPRATMDGYFMKFITQGQSFFDASGDAGAYAGAIPEPDDDAYVTVVGGTTLSTSGPGGTWLGETTWNAPDLADSSGGGISASYPIQSWQTGVKTNGNGASTTLRNIPDVAMVADNIFIVADGGSPEATGGTSVSVQLWGAFAALINQQAHAKGKAPVGFINMAAYSLYNSASYSATFDDITIGDNTNGVTGFYATPGYDLCTGLGTPTGDSFINALVSPDGFVVTPGRGFSANGPVGGPFNITSQTIVLTNIGAASINWSLGGEPTWVTISTNGSTTLTVGAGASVTVSLNSAANALAAGVYTANLWFTNQTSGQAQLRQFTVRVDQNLVHDGGFESGDFSYWNLLGQDAILFNFVDDGYFTPYTANSGLDFAVFGESNSVSFLSQPLPTRPGQMYQITYWLQNATGLNPTEFSSQFGTNVLASQTDLPSFGWTEMQFTSVASSNTTVLQFGGRDDPDYLTLDDVSVVPLPGSVVTVPAPVITSVQRVGQTLIITWSAVSGQMYQVQSTSSLAQPQWAALGNPVTATASTATSPAEPIGASSTAEFYRIEVVP